MESAIMELIENTKEYHIHQVGIVPVGELVFSDGVRKLCEMNSCGLYAKTWACPPGTGTMEECKAKIMQYKNMLVYTTLHMLEDSYDYEGMMAGRTKHEEICSKIAHFLRRNLEQSILILSGEGCAKCKRCTYPDEPCRFPDKLFPSVESYGIEVNRLAESAGVKYINGANTVTYFAGICF